MTTLIVATSALTTANAGSAALLERAARERQSLHRPSTSCASTLVLHKGRPSAAGRALLR